jgi:hypothetical protein
MRAACAVTTPLRGGSFNGPVARASLAAPPEPHFSAVNDRLERHGAPRSAVAAYGRDAKSERQSHLRVRSDATTWPIYPFH